MQCLKHCFVDLFNYVFNTPREARTFLQTESINNLLTLELPTISTKFIPISSLIAYHVKCFVCTNIMMLQMSEFMTSNPSGAVFFLVFLVKSEILGNFLLVVIFTTVLKEK